MGELQVLPSAPSPKGKKAKQILVEHGANELIFAVVGHVGSGPGVIANSLREILENPAGGSYDTTIIKASDKIKEWAKANSEPVVGAGLRRRCVVPGPCVVPRLSCRICF